MGELASSKEETHYLLPLTHIITLFYILLHQCIILVGVNRVCS